MPTVKKRKEKTSGGREFKFKIGKFNVDLRPKHIVTILVAMMMIGLVVSLRPVLSIARPASTVDGQTGSSDKPMLEARPSPGFVAPYVADSAFEEGRPYFMCFWRSDSAPSVAQLGEIDKVRDNLLEKGYQVLLISAYEGQQTANEFIKSKSYKFNSLSDEDGVISKRYDVVSVPTTFLVDETGTIHDMRIGLIKGADILKLL